MRRAARPASPEHLRPGPENKVSSSGDPTGRAEARGGLAGPDGARWEGRQWPGKPPARAEHAPAGRSRASLSTGPRATECAAECAPGCARRSSPKSAEHACGAPAARPAASFRRALDALPVCTRYALGAIAVCLWRCGGAGSCAQELEIKVGPGEVLAGRGRPPDGRRATGERPENGQRGGRRTIGGRSANGQWSAAECGLRAGWRRADGELMAVRGLGMRRPGGADLSQPSHQVSRRPGPRKLRSDGRIRRARRVRRLPGDRQAGGK